jgi:hypothetical protein
MGWVESPLYFCAVTETIVDLANSQLSRTQVPYQRLENEALRPVTTAGDLTLPHLSTASF